MTTLDRAGIEAIIPHRAPFLLVDEIIELEPGKRAVGVKQFAESEAFYAGHFPGHPITPGVLIVEALAQVGAVAILALPENRGKLPFFAGIDGVRFRKPVQPGETLRLEVELLAMRRNVGKGTATASVNGITVSEGVLTFVLMDRTQ